MKKKRCRDCGHKIEVHPDGSFVMHAKDGGAGGLCPGTNCVTRRSVTLTIGGMPIEAINFKHDPDADSLD